MFGRQSKGEDINRTYLLTDCQNEIYEEHECRSYEVNDAAMKFLNKYHLDTVYVWELVEVGDIESACVYNIRWNCGGDYNEEDE